MTESTDLVHKKHGYQYMIRDLQETSYSKFYLTKKLYKTFQEAANKVETGGPEFKVWGRFEPPEYLSNQQRVQAVFGFKKQDDNTIIEEPAYDKKLALYECLEGVGVLRFIGIFDGMYFMEYYIKGFKAEHMGEVTWTAIDLGVAK